MRNLVVSTPKTTRFSRTLSISTENQRPPPIIQNLPPTPSAYSTLRYADKSQQKRESSVSSSKNPLIRLENGKVEEELADFKKYLHKSSVLSKLPAIPKQTPTRSKSITDSQHTAMKERLDRKIKQAQQKMADLKASFKYRQAEKEEIVRNSEIRRSGGNSPRFLH